MFGHHQNWACPMGGHASDSPLCVRTVGVSFMVGSISIVPGGSRTRGATDPVPTAVSKPDFSSSRVPPISTTTDGDCRLRAPEPSVRPFRFVVGRLQLPLGLHEFLHQVVLLVGYGLTPIARGSHALTAPGMTRAERTSVIYFRNKRQPSSALLRKIVSCLFCGHGRCVSRPTCAWYGSPQVGTCPCKGVGDQRPGGAAGRSATPLYSLQVR